LKTKQIFLADIYHLIEAVSVKRKKIWVTIPRWACTGTDTDHVKVV